MKRIMGEIKMGRIFDHFKEIDMPEIMGPSVEWMGERVRVCHDPELGYILERQGHFDHWYASSFLTEEEAIALVED